MASHRTGARRLVTVLAFHQLRSRATSRLLAVPREFGCHGFMPRDTPGYAIKETWDTLGILGEEPRWG